MLIDPTTGELIDATNFDELAAAAVRIKEAKDKLWDAERGIKERIAEMAKGDQKTQRVRGTGFQAEVTKADVSWSQPLLKAAYSELPDQMRDEVLRIGEVAVNADKWKVWQKTTGTPAFEEAKKKVAAACMGVTGAPSVKVYPIEQENPF